MIIDVSKWNGTIDWKKVKADGVDTVFIRCGVSTAKKCQTDSKFKTYIKGALAQGIKVGLYYYSFSKTEAGAKQEADYCRKICAPYKDQLTYPIYIDIEEESCVKYAKTVAQAFCDRMKAEGWEAGVYTTTSVFKNQLKNFKGYSKWVAYPSSKKPSGDYDLWQYSWKGKVNGITGDVDLDKWLKEPVIAVPEPEKPVEEEKPTPVNPKKEKPIVKAANPTEKFTKAYDSTWQVATMSGEPLNLRAGAGTNFRIMTKMPKGTKVRCFGYYTGGWLFVRYETEQAIYEGFAMRAYLKKV